MVFTDKERTSFLILAAERLTELQDVVEQHLQFGKNDYRIKPYELHGIIFYDHTKNQWCQAVVKHV